MVNVAPLIRSTLDPQQCDNEVRGTHVTTGLYFSTAWRGYRTSVIVSRLTASCGAWLRSATGSSVRRSRTDPVVAPSGRHTCFTALPLVLQYRKTLALHPGVKQFASIIGINWRNTLKALYSLGDTLKEAPDEVTVVWSCLSGTRGRPLPERICTKRDHAYARFVEVQQGMRPSDHLLDVV